MGALSSVPILKLKEIQGGHAGIEMKMKRCLASSLTVGEARELQQLMGFFKIDTRGKKR